MNLGQINEKAKQEGLIAIIESGEFRGFKNENN